MTDEIHAAHERLSAAKTFALRAASAICDARRAGADTSALFPELEALLACWRIERLAFERLVIEELIASE